ncbi:hypothetical protein PWT90_04155 [Aphanocladium album]|nr:hypothetical protein PWT90_04155 [Aphanocladium album]
MVQTFLANYTSLNVTLASEIIRTDKARTRWGGVLRDSYWDGANQTYFNPRSGWGDGNGAVQSLTQAAIDQGAQHQLGRASKLIIDGTDGEVDGSRRCRGVRLEDGTEMYSDHVVVATGCVDS